MSPDLFFYLWLEIDHGCKSHISVLSYVKHHTSLLSAVNKNIFVRIFIYLFFYLFMWDILKHKTKLNGFMWNVR